MQTFAIVNQKGGCGKTTTAINLAGVFAGRGYRTLLVDMDPQGHCAAGLAIPENRIDLHIGDAMAAAPDTPVDTKRLLWRVSRNLDLAPATVRLTAIEAPRGELAGKSDAEKRLKFVLGRFETQYDICLIDCSPAIGLLAFNALVAADEVLIPVETGFFSLQGATKQINTIKAIGKRLGVAPTHRVLATMHDPASMLSKDLLEELRRRFANRLIPVVIRFDQALKEAASFGQPVIEYSAESSGASDYAALADWLVAHVLGRAKDPARTQVDAGDEAAVPEPEPTPSGSREPPSLAPEPISLPGSRAADMVNRARRLQSRSSDPTIGAQPSPNVTAAATAPLPSPVPSPVVVVELKPPASPAPPMPVESAPQPTAPADRHTAQAPPEVAPPAPNAQHWPSPGFGAQVTPFGVIFRAPVSIGRSVAIAGDFNQWSPERTPLRLNETDGVLEAVVFMPPGSTSQYRLVIDGNWIADPYNPCLAPNPFGGTNSVVSVPFMHTDALAGTLAVSRPGGTLEPGRLA